MINIGKPLQRAIFAHAQTTYPEECCGLVIQQKHHLRYFPCRNQAVSAREHFMLHPEDYARAQDEGEIIALVHSHPDATTQPSLMDEAQCHLSGLPWIIVSFPEGDIRILMPDSGIKPLAGRPFVHGIRDCYALIRDWYQLTRNIPLPDFHREDNWWNTGKNLYNDHYRDAGFIAAQHPIERGDVILMQIRASVANHAAIYLGDGLLLHHLYGHLSQRVPYGGYWQERTVKVLRWEGSGF